MSSAGAVDQSVVTAPTEGIHAIDPATNPDFYDANVAIVDYCSSDGWSGDREGTPGEPTSSVKRWHFRGRAIFAAVIDELRARGLDSAEEIFLTGGSAGGMGVAMNLDDLQAMFPGRRVVGLMDAGFFIDYPSYDPQTQLESTASPTARYLELSQDEAAWGGRGDESCERSPPPEGTLYCRATSFVVRSHQISTPLFVRQSMADGTQTKAFIDSTEQGPNADAYRRRFWAALHAELAAVTDTAVFATADSKHGVVGTDAWGSFAVDGTNLVEAVGAWYRDPCGQRRSRIAQP
jgi:Pectinacetylesterase